MKRRRVKITGIGPVTPAGIGKDEFWKGILEPVSRVRPFHGVSTEFGEFVAAYIDDERLQSRAVKSPQLKGAARHTLFAATAASLAIADTGLSLADVNSLNPIFIAGACLMDFGGICHTIESFAKRGTRGGLPKTVFTTNVACIAAISAAAIGLTAKTLAVESSCASGLDAIGCAARLVADGETDYAVCGGTDAPLYRTPLVELRAAGLTPSSNDRAGQLSRPFDLWRTTGVISEGACMFVLEPESSPRPGYAYVSGYAFANDRSDDLCSGMAEAIPHALGEARVRASDVESISAWGPGHQLVDAAEARALRTVFGATLSRIPTYSIKGAIGSPLGAAPAIQVAAAALGHRHGIMPPTVNWEYTDPVCDLNLSARARCIDTSITVVNAHGLSGVNSALVLKR
jgi:3-oxoacyl-(acyl-carrier-protein) synthase